MEALIIDLVARYGAGHEVSPEAVVYGLIHHHLNGDLRLHGPANVRVALDRDAGELTTLTVQIALGITGVKGYDLPSVEAVSTSVAAYAAQVHGDGSAEVARVQARYTPIEGMWDIYAMPTCAEDEVALPA